MVSTPQMSVRVIAGLASARRRRCNNRCTLHGVARLQHVVLLSPKPETLALSGIRCWHRWTEARSCIEERQAKITGKALSP